MVKILSKYVPDAAVSPIFELVKNNNVHLKIVNEHDNEIINHLMSIIESLQGDKSQLIEYSSNLNYNIKVLGNMSGISIFGQRDQGQDVRSANSIHFQLTLLIVIAV